MESYKSALAVQLYIRLSTDGGATFLTTGYTNGYIGVAAGGTAASASSSGSQPQINSGAAQSLAGTGRIFFEISDADSATLYTTMDGTASNSFSQGAVYNFVGGHATAAAHNAVRLFAQTGNINEGEFRLYGLV